MINLVPVAGFAISVLTLSPPSLVFVRATEVADRIPDISATACQIEWNVCRSVWNFARASVEQLQAMSKLDVIIQDYQYYH